MPEEVTRISLEEEYKKDTGITPEDIRKLRQWLETQPHLPKDITGPNSGGSNALIYGLPRVACGGMYPTQLRGCLLNLDLILTYHSCDRSAEVAKQVLDLHYTLRTLFTPFFKDRALDSGFEKVLDTVVLRALPLRSRDGYAVFYGRLINFEPKNFDFSKVMKVVLMALDLWAYEEGTWPGFAFIFDLHGIRVGHLARLDVQTIQQFLYYLQEAMLVKVRGLHFMNAPTFMDKLLMMIKPFMKKELVDMLTIHQIGARTIDKFVPMKALPKESGGVMGTIAECREQLLVKMRANQEFFEQENKKRAVESMRPGKPKTISDIFGGVEGSFKKLEID